MLHFCTCTQPFLPWITSHGVTKVKLRLVSLVIHCRTNSTKIWPTGFSRWKIRGSVVIWVHPLKITRISMQDFISSTDRLVSYRNKEWISNNWLMPSTDLSIIPEIISIKHHNPHKVHKTEQLVLDYPLKKKTKTLHHTAELTQS